MQRGWLQLTAKVCRQYLFAEIHGRQVRHHADADLRAIRNHCHAVCTNYVAELSEEKGFDGRLRPSRGSVRRARIPMPCPEAPSNHHLNTTTNSKQTTTGATADERARDFQGVLVADCRLLLLTRPVCRCLWWRTIALGTCRSDRPKAIRYRQGAVPLVFRPIDGDG